MSIWNIEEIREVLKDEIIEDNFKDSNTEIDYIEVDNRRLKEKSLFICVEGNKNDGHDFIEQAFKDGAILVLASKKLDKFRNNDKVILVKDGFKSLEALAIYARNRTKAKIIAITGSVGKTTTKDIINGILSKISKCYSTFGNFNNYFGVRITLVNLPQDVDFAVIEIGMNHSGEIEELSRIICPDIAVITSINSAHIGNFNNEEEIAIEKSNIFLGVKEDGFAIINNDSQYYHLMKTKAIECDISKDNIISFGFKETSDIRLNLIENIPNQLSSRISILFNGKRENINYEINSINQVVIFNSLIVIAILKTLNINLNNITKYFSEIKLRNGRGNIIKINKNNNELTIIDDSYNASPQSIIAAINYLNDIKHSNQNISTAIILGDMFELGKRELAEHIKIGNILVNSKIDKIFLVGELMKNIDQNLFEQKIKFFHNSNEAANNINSLIGDNDVILVKGSRGMKMEKIINSIKNSQ